MGSREYMAGRLSSFTEGLSATIPGRMIGVVRDRLHTAWEVMHFQWELRFEPPSIPRFNSPRVSIVIPETNQARETLACLKSIVSNVPGTSFEVIAASQYSKKRAARVLRTDPGPGRNGKPEADRLWRVVHSWLAMATGEYLVFLQNTASVADGWLASLAATFDDLPHVGLVVPKLLHPDGRLKEAGRGCDCSGWKTDDPAHPRCNFVREVDSCSPACMMIPSISSARLADSIATTLKTCRQAQALALKVRRAGFKVVYQPEARVFHRESPARGASGTTAISTSESDQSTAFSRPVQ